MVSRLAVQILAESPYLMKYVPMFHDKGFIECRKDPPAFIFRIIIRHFISLPLIVNAMEMAVLALERYVPRSSMLRLIYRLIISWYIYRGYREGLRVRFVCLCSEKRHYRKLLCRNFSTVLRQGFFYFVNSFTFKGICSLQTFDLIHSHFVCPRFTLFYGPG